MRFSLFLLFIVSHGLLAQDAIVPFNSSNLPIVVINTNGGTIVDDPKIGASMGIIDNGVERNYTTDTFDFTGKIGIEIRGSSSQMFPKKQYGIELRDDAGEGLAAPLLGMPAEEDWVLFAPYNDKSLMRDVLSYNLGRQLGGYAPRARYCELLLNGVYQGVYVLIEKIKRDKNRLNINKLDPDEITGNNLTGGYIIKIDKTTGGTGDGWTSGYKPPLGTNQVVYFQYEYPDAGDIVSEQSAYIQSFIRQFEDVLHGENFDDPTSGYAKYIDVDSFVDYLIMQELTRNVDGYRLSTFMYKQRDSDGGKLHMGPIWDFNLGFGNADYCDGGKVEGWALDFNNVCPTDFWLIPFWWKKLFQDEAFGAKVAARWTSLRSGVFRSDHIQAKIDSINTLLGEGEARNFDAWKVLGKYVWPNSYVGSSFADEVTYLKGWIDQRLVWMDANMPALITAVSQEINASTVSALPNPFEQFVSIQYKITQESAVGISIYDGTGRVVGSSILNHALPGEYTYRWDAAHNPSGIYYYQVRANAQILGAGKLNRR
jgi:hypothetical protein